MAKGKGEFMKGIILKENPADMFYDEINQKIDNKKYGSFVFAGDHGSGKSTIINDFIKRIENNNNEVINGKDGKYSYVFFYNAWENTNPNQMQGLILTILKCLDKELFKLNKEKKRKEKFYNYINDAIEILTVLLSLDPKFMVLCAGLKCLSIVLKRKIRKNIKSENGTPKTNAEVYESIKRGFSLLTKNANVILIVDELDRCLPNVQLEFLESLHHISDSSSILTILSLVPKAIAHSIKSHYGDSFSVDDYMSKVFNGVIELEYSNEDDVCRNICDKYLRIKPDSPDSPSNFHDMITIFCEELSKQQTLTFRELIKAKEIIEQLVSIGGNNFYNQFIEADRISLFFFACAYAKGPAVYRSLLKDWSSILSEKKEKTVSKTKGVIELIMDVIYDYWDRIAKELLVSYHKLRFMEIKDSDDKKMNIDMIYQIKHVSFENLDVNIQSNNEKDKENEILKA